MSKGALPVLPTLCKFKPINEYLIDSLKKKEIYIPRVTQLNDPTERIFTDGVSLGRVDESGLSGEDLFKHLSDQSVKSREYLTKCGVFSASEYNVSEKGFDYLTQWAHYGDNYKGVCLVFKPREPETDSQPKWVQVDYVSAKKLGAGSWQGTSIEGGSCHYDTAVNSLRRKFDAWEMENEWRLIFPPEESGKSCSWEPYFDLTLIMFGYCSEYDKINEVIRSLHPDLIQRVKEKRLNIAKATQPKNTSSSLRGRKFSPEHVVFCYEGKAPDGSQCDHFPWISQRFSP